MEYEYPKNKYKLTIGDFYDLWYIKERKKPLPRKLYMEIAKDILWSVSRALITELYEYAAPNRMGKFTILPIKAGTQKLLDWVAIREVGKHVRQKFPLTHKHVYKHRWLKHNKYTSFDNKGHYTFKAVLGGRDKKIGIRGLYAHMFALKQDPTARKFERV